MNNSGTNRNFHGPFLVNSQCPGKPAEIFEMNIRPASDQIKQPDRPKLADIWALASSQAPSDGDQRHSHLFAGWRPVLWLLLGMDPPPHLSADVRHPDDQRARSWARSGKGLAGNMRRHYPTPVIYPLIALLLVAAYYQYQGRSRSDGRGVAASGRRAAAGFRRHFCHRHRPRQSVHALFVTRRS